MIQPPAPNPCGSCPYRQDVPPGVWSEEEYEKLPPFDAETAFQPPSVFLCHQQDGRLCAGWVACHPMEHSLGLRVASAMGQIDPEDLDGILDYTTEVPLWSSGKEAAERGLEAVEDPSPEARRLIGRLEKKIARKT